MQIKFPYGHQTLPLEITPTAHVSLLEPRRSQVEPIRLALAAPIGSPRLCEIARPGQSVVIVTNDITRPRLSQVLLPPILEELNRAGVQDTNITVVFALGTHRPHSEAERIKLVGHDIYSRVRCIDSDPSRTVFVGTTSRGTPIEVFEPVVRADLRVVLGNIEPHYFAGYSGGAKAIVPGVCSTRTICLNHALMTEPMARQGVLNGNPVREDLEEGAALVGIDFMVNVIFDENKQIVIAVAGHPVEAHRWGCRAVEYLSSSPIDHLADIVIASAGGYPKDLNIYQAQKALDNAAAAVRPGGIIIWIAECPEGFGNATFEEWMLEGSALHILSRIRENFVIGGHKAAAIARVLQHADVMLVSSLPPDTVRRAGMEPFDSVKEALAAALKECGEDAHITAIPEAASVMPIPRQSTS